MKFDFDTPIIIPSLRRIHPKKKDILCIVSCLNDIFKHYNASAVHVIAQEYSDEEKEFLTQTYPTVTFHWFETRMGIIKTFNRVKTLGCELGPWYVHYDDDVEMSTPFSDNPTLLAFVSVMSQFPDRVGVVTCFSTSIIHFGKHGNLFKLHGNPAQLLLINSAAARNCTYDERFENFKSDTDFTMQIAAQGYIPISFCKYFSFNHTVALSKKVTDEKTGKTRFENYNNLSDSGKSIGGIRTQDIRTYEFSELNKKWPLVKTTKNFRTQILKKSIVHLTGYQEHEIRLIEEAFDQSLILNRYPKFYREAVSLF